MMIMMIFLCPVGMLTISDFINILRYYYKSPLVRINIYGVLTKCEVKMAGYY